MLNLILDLDETLISNMRVYRHENNPNKYTPFIYNIKGIDFFYINFKIKKNKVKTKKVKKKIKTKKKQISKIKWDNYDYLIYKRKNLDIFLKFCFKHFNVGFWTNGAIEYGSEIIKNILSPEEIKKCFCIIYRLNFDDNFYYYKDVVTKRKFKIKKTNRRGSKKLEYIYNKDIRKDNTILFDDGLYNKALNCENTILIPEFTLNIINDTCLFKLIKYLNKIKKNKTVKDIKLIENELFKDYKINEKYTVKKDKYEEGDIISTDLIKNAKDDSVLIKSLKKNKYKVMYINKKSNKIEEKAITLKDIKFKYILS